LVFPSLNSQILSCESSILVGPDWIFKACRVYPSDVWFGRARLSPSGLWFIVRMSPPGYASAWLLASRARFRFTW
jgi:hypothetical protein